MSERNCFILTLTIVIALILSIATFSFCVSGIREKSDHLFSLTDGRKYNSLIIRKFPFDSIILGSSMSQGFKCTEFDAAFGGQSMKLCISGANFAEMKELLDFSVKHKKIKRVMIDVPVAFFARELTLDAFPLEYYRENNDLVRLKKSFSINAFVDEFDFFWDYLRGKVKYTTRDELYDWNRRNTCGESKLAQDVLYKSVNSKNFLNNDAAYERAVANAEKVVIPMFQKYHDIEFIIFFPPFSMMYYKDVDIDKYLNLKQKITELVLACPNVKLYDFETASDIMKNLNNYKDKTHYSGAINSWMISQMKADNYRVTHQNKDKLLADFRACLNSYDFQKEYDRLKATYGNSRKSKKSKKSKK